MMRHGQFTPLALVLAAAGCLANPMPSPTGPASPTSRTPSPPSLPTATVATTPSAGVTSPRLGDEALDLEAFGWQMVAPELDPASAGVIGHWLSVGTIATEEPTWSTRLAEAPWQFTASAQQQPVVDGPVAGTVVYVGDDGTTSEIRAVGIDGEELPIAGATPHIVYAARLAPDARTVYLVVLDRATGRDLGVFALTLGGGADLEPIMPPASARRAEGDTGRLVAVKRFVRALRVSADGSLLARLACGEPFGRCILDVIALPDGPMLTYDPPDQSGELTGLGDGLALGTWSCETETAPCSTGAVSLNDQSVTDLPGHPAAVNADGGWCCCSSRAPPWTPTGSRCSTRHRAPRGPSSSPTARSARSTPTAWTSRASASRSRQAGHRCG